MIPDSIPIPDSSDSTHDSRTQYFWFTESRMESKESLFLSLLIPFLTPWIKNIERITFRKSFLLTMISLIWAIREMSIHLWLFQKHNYFLPEPSNTWSLFKEEFFSTSRINCPYLRKLALIFKKSCLRKLWSHCLKTVDISNFPRKNCSFWVWGKISANKNKYRTFLWKWIEIDISPRQKFLNQVFSILGS